MEDRRVRPLLTELLAGAQFIFSSSWLPSPRFKLWTLAGYTVLCPGRHRIQCAMRKIFKLLKNISTVVPPEVVSLPSTVPCSLRHYFYEWLDWLSSPSRSTQFAKCCHHSLLDFGVANWQLLVPALVISLIYYWCSVLSSLSIVRELGDVKYRVVE
jgi:hypothetical protein